MSDSLRMFASAVVSASAAVAALKMCGGRVTITVGDCAQKPSAKKQDAAPIETPATQTLTLCTASERAVSTDSEYLPGPVSDMETGPSSEEEAATAARGSKGKRYRCKHRLTECKVEHSHMQAAVDEAREGLLKGEGGPFGCAIVKDGTVVARAHNMVLQTNDPTAHAEVTCIRKASSRLGRFDLSDCVLYTSCEPCPMCFGAIHWAKIPVCVYAADRNDAAEAGFDDAFIYDAIKGTADEEHVAMVRHEHTGAVDVFRQKYASY
eukprot:TRINITY_DN8337_c2_g1_i1.p2 TRINITY_DN8337_c2_g1~~TRINITY_DN8337_c2_g1_i1.p2  ORF type:complete len:265 (+),score=61.46 TRINITY_DN8337_c2_g1_i1:120-914(+)